MNKDMVAMADPAASLPRADRRTPLRQGGLGSPSDSLNREIIRMLEKDGRVPFATIADALGVSEGTVRNRVNWMKELGMLRIVALADPRAIDYKADAMLGIKVAPGTTPKQLAERLAAHNEVVYILLVSGRFDLLVEVVFEEHDAFVKFLERECYGRPDVASVETMAGLTMYKNQFLLRRNLP